MANYESRNKIVKLREKYPYSYNEKDRYMKYDVNNPKYESFRCFRTEPQEGYDHCHPSTSRTRINLYTYDLIVTKPQAQPRTDSSGNIIECR